MRVAGLCGLGLLALTTSSFAADLPILRGSMAPPLGYMTYYPWSGFYIGGQAGFSSAGVDFSKSAAGLTSYILRGSVLQDDVGQWDVLEKKATGSASFGGFIGYNMQWDDAVLGVELNYSRVSLRANAADTLGPLVINDNTGAPDGHTYNYTVTTSANASVTLTDLATIRGRAGWSAGPVLPYVFGGLAIGRASVYRSATVSGTLTDSYTVNVYDPISGATITVPVNDTYPLSLPQPTKTESQNDYFGYGYTLGAGIDWAVLPNLFLRAEYEYIGFTSFFDMKININNVRAGAALKF